MQESVLMHNLLNVWYSMCLHSIPVVKPFPVLNQSEEGRTVRSLGHYLSQVSVILVRNVWTHGCHCAERLVTEHHAYYTIETGGH